eukprot:1729860-Pleurochrysis_carterae.AAC.1
MAARPWACPSCRSSLAATASPCRRRNVTAIPKRVLEARALRLRHRKERRAQRRRDQRLLPT